MKFENKVVMISGATGGLGAEITKKLSNKKCKLALFARREPILQEVSDRLKSNGVECIYMKCDVSKIESVKKAVRFTHESFGRIDVSILTAGILLGSNIETFNSNAVTNSMKVNFFGSVYFIEQLLPIMISQKSGIIAVTSTLPDRRGTPSSGAYGASKAALSWLVESLRADAKQKYNINFITIKPGLIKTPMISDYSGRGAIQPEKAAKLIIQGVEREKKIIQFPLMPVLATRITDIFPAFAYDKLPDFNRRGWTKK